MTAAFHSRRARPPLTENTDAPKVLLFSITPELLTTYAEALGRCGLRLECVSQVNEAANLIGRTQFDCLLVGFRVDEKQRNRIAALFKRMSPKGRVIFLYYGSIQNAERADAVLNVLNDPAEVARAIQLT